MVVESILPQASQRYHIFQGVMMLTLISMRMPTDLSPVNPKVEMLLELWEEENDAILEPAFYTIDNWL